MIGLLCFFLSVLASPFKSTFRLGVGKFCREREAAVNERRQAMDAAMKSVKDAADLQTDAAIRIVAWATLGALQPTGNDFAMLRLVLLAHC